MFFNIFCNNTPFFFFQCTLYASARGGGGASHSDIIDWDELLFLLSFFFFMYASSLASARGGGGASRTSYGVALSVIAQDGK